MEPLKEAIQRTEGDISRRWGKILVLVSAVCAIIAAIWFPIFKDGWSSFLDMPHGAGLFVVGLLVLMSPVIALFFGWVFLVQSLFQPRSAVTPVADGLIAASLLLVSLALACFCAYHVWVGATTGVVHFRGGVAISMRGNQYAYWFGMAFWIAGATAFVVSPVIKLRKGFPQKSPN